MIGYVTITSQKLYGLSWAPLVVNGSAIRILQNLSEAEQLSTLVHELAHLRGAEIYLAFPSEYA